MTTHSRLVTVVVPAELGPGDAIVQARWDDDRVAYSEDPQFVVSDRAPLPSVVAFEAATTTTTVASTTIPLVHHDIGTIGRGHDGIRGAWFHSGTAISRRAGRAGSFFHEHDADCQRFGRRAVALGVAILVILRRKINTPTPTRAVLSSRSGSGPFERSERVEMWNYV